MALQYYLFDKKKKKSVSRLIPTIQFIFLFFKFPTTLLFHTKIRWSCLLTDNLLIKLGFSFSCLRVAAALLFRIFF